jgi:hypothetical protein
VRVRDGSAIQLLSSVSRREATDLSRRITTPIPEPILQLQRQLADFRNSQLGRTKLPESLWQAAAELARQYGIYSVAHPLRLDYMGLKKRLGEVASQRRKPSAPAFVELIAAQSAAPEECVVEFESSRGSKMRIHWKSTTPPDWSGLLRAWRETEA